MSELMTSIYTPHTKAGDGFANYGRKTRAEMIEQFRRRAEFELVNAQAVLATPDDEFIVEQYRGPYARTNLIRIEPESSSTIGRD